MALHQYNRAPDLMIAAALWLGAVLLLARTNDMGFVRDEAFYFGHAETYQNWFVRLEAGGKSRSEALERGEILETWRNNAEHPPLAKMLFGYSWRIFGRKLRPVDRFRDSNGEHLVDIFELGPAHGFSAGSKVVILRPQKVGERSSPDGRHLVAGDVIERTDGRATVSLSGDADVAKLRELCQPAGPGGGGVIRRTGCEALERRSLYWMSESAAMRLPGAMFGGLVVALIYLAGRMAFASTLTAAGRGQLRRPFALLAAVGYLCIPQPFWHAHLCTFDTAITALLLATTLFWHRAISSKAWIWPTALLWGLALLTKHNALFLPVPLIAHWLYNAALERRIVLHWPAEKWRLVAGLGAALLGAALGGMIHPVAGLGAGLLALGAAGFTLELPAVPGVFAAMAAAGPLVLVAGWPLLWVDTFDNLLRWIEFHLHHEHYMQTWFGQVLQYPPFPPQYAAGMTVLTWPLPLLVPVAIGFVTLYVPRHLRVPPPVLDVERFDAWLFAHREDADGLAAEQRSFDRLLLVCALWPIALIALPGTPIFGGTKHWMPAFPFLLLIGARGVQSVWRTVLAFRHDVLGEPDEWAAMAAWVLALALLVPAAMATRDTGNHGAAYYNELVGGVRGAAQAGMQRQFWGGSTREGLDFVNRKAPAGATVWFHKSAWGAFQMYQREGWLRHDLRYGGSPEGSQLGIYHHQKDHDDYETDLLRDYRELAPAFQYAIDGVPILSVYQRPAATP